MEKRILVFIIGIIVLPVFTLAADVNLALDGTPEFNGLGGNHVRWWSDAQYINDDSTSSGYVGCYAANGWAAQFSGSYNAIVNFPQTIPILNRVESSSGAACACGCSGSEKLYVKIGGVWTDEHSSGPGGTDGVDGPWANVEAVKFEMSGFKCSGCGLQCSTTPVNSYLYELRAFGPEPCGDGSCDAGETCSTCPQDCGPCYTDSGLRIYNDGVPASIAADPTGSKLKMWDGTTAVDIALVPTNDAMASKVRIRIEGVTWALRKF